MNVHFFRGIQKSFPRTRTTTTTRTTTRTNKPFLRPRQRSLAVKKMQSKQSKSFYMKQKMIHDIQSKKIKNVICRALQTLNNQSSRPENTIYQIITDVGT